MLSTSRPTLRAGVNNDDVNIVYLHIIPNLRLCTYYGSSYAYTKLCSISSPPPSLYFSVNYINSHARIRYQFNVISRHKPLTNSGHAHLCRAPQPFEFSGDNVGYNPVYRSKYTHSYIHRVLYTTRIQAFQAIITFII